MYFIMIMAINLEGYMTSDPVNLKNKYDTFSDHFSPKIVARMNNVDFKLVKFKGDFVWHTHHDTDEAFLVIEGHMRIDFRDRSVALRAGELFVVKRGLEHKPASDVECKIMLIEPAGTLNTGDAGGSMTATNDAWI
jgi:mannose-6-phosphate isomerase-like protein (cupin superfamily)